MVYVMDHRNPTRPLAPQPSHNSACPVAEGTDASRGLAAKLTTSFGRLDASPVLPTSTNSRSTALHHPDSPHEMTWISISFTPNFGASGHAV
jgi:hypothetical protein